MSRIAGILSAGGSSTAHESVNRILGEMKPKTGVANAQHFAEAEMGELFWLVLGYTGVPRSINADRSAIATLEQCIVAFDGCLYEKELGVKGSDSREAASFVAKLYRTHGIEGALNRLHGDFAFALFDVAANVLYLCRDRLGARPLYYCTGRDFIGFASRPDALLTLPINKSFSAQYAAVFAGSHYRYFDHDPSGSPYAAISQLPAGCFARIEGSGVHIDRYWTLHDGSDSSASENELAEQYRELLLDAVKRRTNSFAKPGFLLSGGMDSSSVLACAVRGKGAKLPAFSSVYEDRSFDESEEIQSIVGDLTSEWTALPIAPGSLLEEVAEIIREHGEPIATATWFSHFQLARTVAAAGHDGLFGGLGGDELNAGEYEYFPMFFADLKSAGKDSLLASEIERWAHYHDHPIFKKNAEVAGQKISALTDLAHPGRTIPDRTRRQRYTDTVAPDFFPLAAFAPQPRHPFASYLKNRCYQDLFYETLPCCVRAEDRHAAAFGFRHCDPFLDHRLVELMFRVPGELKIKDGVTKYLMRKAVNGILPDVCRNRVKKVGWNAPVHLWVLQPEVEDLINSKAFTERGIYDPARVQHLYREHRRIVEQQTNEENHMMFFWQLLNLELWLREFAR